MPYYEMRDAFGSVYRMTTMDTETAQRWFDEWLPRLFGPELAEEFGLPVLILYGLPMPDNRTADWPTYMSVSSQPFTIPRDPALALAAIGERRAWIEEETRKAHADGQ